MGASEGPHLHDDAYWAQLPHALSLRTVALIVRLSETTVLRRLQDGTIPGHFIARSWIILKTEFRAWLADRRNIPLTTDFTIDPLAEFEEHLGIPELMELFGKTKQTVRKWLSENHIPGYQISGKWMVHKTELRSALASTHNQARGPSFS